MSKSRCKENCLDEVKISGYFIKDIIYSYSRNGKFFYRSVFGIERLSGYVDEIPVVFNAKVMEKIKTLQKSGVEHFLLDGFLVSHDAKDKNGVHLEVKVRVTDVTPFNYEKNINSVDIECFVVKDPYFKITNRGSIITSLIFAVNRGNESYYFPAIAWGNAACDMAKLVIGQKLRVQGRIQSRTVCYGKNTYELSIYKYNRLTE